MRAKQFYLIVNKDTGDLVKNHLYATKEDAETQFCKDAAIALAIVRWEWENPEFSWHIISLKNKSYYVEGGDWTYDKNKATAFKTYKDAEKHYYDLVTSVGRGTYHIVRSFKNSLTLDMR